MISWTIRSSVESRLNLRDERLRRHFVLKLGERGRVKLGLFYFRIGLLKVITLRSGLVSEWRRESAVVVLLLLRLFRLSKLSFLRRLMRRWYWLSIAAMLALFNF